MQKDQYKAGIKQKQDITNMRYGGTSQTLEPPKPTKKQQQKLLKQYNQHAQTNPNYMHCPKCNKQHRIDNMVKAETKPPTMVCYLCNRNTQ
jgi:uncharacterized protein with PIN domain